MDAFEKVIVVSILVSLVALGFIAYVASDAIQGAKIPHQEYGIVTWKGPVTDGHLANYMVSISTGKTLYILSNSTLYAGIQENLGYLFIGHIDYTNQMTLIDSISQVNRTVS